MNANKNAKTMLLLPPRYRATPSSDTRTLKLLRK
jgi:hypothetical protein